MNRVKLILLAALALALSLLIKTLAAQQAPSPQVQEEPKNLQVLRGMQRQQLLALMQSWSAALGVQCNYCHIRPFEADTPRKAVARLMQRDYVMGMKHKDGSPLSCKDCHQGQPNFLRTRPFEGILGKKLPDIRVLTGMDEERLMQVMAGFTKALGVKCSYCHASDTDFDAEVPRKQIARFMVTEFTGGLVKQDGSAVSCADCHKGHARLLAVLPFPQREDRRPPISNQPEPKKPNL
jgi:nitrate/TMAO reductase-like tetraheme cytochrome c subunit